MKFENSVKNIFLCNLRKLAKIAGNLLISVVLVCNSYSSNDVEVECCTFNGSYSILRIMNRCILRDRSGAILSKVEFKFYNKTINWTKANYNRR